MTRKQELIFYVFRVLLKVTLKVTMGLVAVNLLEGEVPHPLRVVVVVVILVWVFEENDCKSLF